MRINNNMMAMNTHRQLGMSNTGGAKSMEKLSSGFRINRAGDDAAGLAISEKMRGQIRGLNQASTNAQDGISLIQTAEGALNETHAILQRMRELAVQSSTDTNTDEDRSNIQDEIDQLTTEITRIAETTEFNTMNLLGGKFEGKKFHIGANEGQDITFDVADMSSNGLELLDDIIKATGKFEETTGKIGSDIKIKVGSGAALDKGVPVASGFPVEGGVSGGVAVSGKISTKDITGIKINTKVDNNKLDVRLNKDGTLEITLETDASGKVTTTNTQLQTELEKYGFTIDMGELSGGAKVASGLAGAEYKIETVEKDIIYRDTNVQGLKVSDKDGSTKSIETTKDSKLIAAGGLNSGEFKMTENEDGAVTIVFGSGTTQAELKTFLEDNGYEVEELVGHDISGTVVLDTKGAVESEVRADNIDGQNLNVSTQEAATKAITTVNDAISQVSKQRSQLGAIQNRLEHTIKNLDTSSENLQASESRIRDVDMAKEMMEQTKQNILQQASTAMLAQANQAPQTVLSLLR